MEGIPAIAESAAHIVARGYGGRAVGSLAEYDDLLQEARILLATKLSGQVRDGTEHRLIHFRLIQRLRQVAARNGKWARKRDSLEQIREREP